MFLPKNLSVINMKSKYQHVEITKAFVISQFEIAIVLRLAFIGGLQFIFPLIENPMQSAIVASLLGVIGSLAYYFLSKVSDYVEKKYGKNEIVEGLSLGISLLIIMTVIASGLALLYFLFFLSVFTIRYAFMFIGAFLLLGLTVFLDVIIVRIYIALLLNKIFGSGAISQFISSLYYIAPLFFIVDILRNKFDTLIIATFIIDLVIVISMLIMLIIDFIKK